MADYDRWLAMCEDMAEEEARIAQAEEDALEREREAERKREESMTEEELAAEWAEIRARISGRRDAEGGGRA